MPEPTTPETRTTSYVASEPTAPGVAPTFPQEQLDRYAALVLSVMQLRNYVALHRARLPAALLARWDAWYQGLGEVLQRTQTDQLALRQVLGHLPTYQGELESYRAAFAQHGGPAASSRSPAPQTSAPCSTPERSRFKPLLIGGAALTLGLLAGYTAASSEGSGT